MAPPAYTVRLANHVMQQTAAWEQLFPAITAGAVIIRDLVIVNPGTAAVGEIAIRILTLAKAGDTWLYYAKALDVGTVHLELRQALRPGERAEAYSSSAGVHIWLTGYEFSA